MASLLRKRVFVLLAFGLGLWGCDKGSSNGGTGPGGGGLCPDPQFVFSPRFLPDDSTHTDVIQFAQTDGSDIFFTTTDAAYRVSAAGGEPVQLANPGNLTTLFNMRSKPILQVGSRFFLFQRNANHITLHEMPKTGTALTPVIDPLPVDTSEDGSITSLGMDATYFYWQAEDIHFDSFTIPPKTHSTYNLYRLPWAGGAAQPLYSGASNRITQFRIQGGTLFLVLTPPSKTGDSVTARDTLAYMPATGGTPTVLRSLDPSWAGEFIWDTDASYLYLQLWQDVSTYKAGVARVALPGTGTPEFIFEGNPNAAIADGVRMVIADYRQVKPDPDILANWAYGIYTVPSPGAASSYLTCVSSEAWTLHTVNLAGKTLYVGLKSDTDEKYGIAKISVP